jgi:hypothetical protein
MAAVSWVDWRRALVAALLLGACHDQGAVRLTGARGDTLLVNAAEPTRLSVEAVDAQGNAARVIGATWRSVGEGPFTLAEDGTVHCTGSGDGAADVSHGAMRARLTVRCRPLRSVRPLVLGPLVVGGPPAAFALQGLGLDLQPVAELAARVGVRDTSVVVLRDTLLYPRRRGVTSLLVTLAHCVTDHRLEVIEHVTDPSALEPSQVFEDTLALVPEEIRSWTLRPNLYTLELEADSLAHQSLAFGAPGFDCARISDRPRALSCLSRTPARVVVRHTGVTPEPLRAVVRLRVSVALHPDSSAARLRIAQRNAAQAARRQPPTCPIAL